MFRLNQKAFKILATEVEKAAEKDNLAGEVARQIAIKRLNKLRFRRGTAVTEAELKELFQDILPDFRDRAIKKAVKVNRPPSKLWLILKAGASIATTAGLILLINLPYPMIRRPVASKAPILLLPSYLSMDYHYRQAIAKVEQADRLVNYATSLADLELGAEKVVEAQKHLDKLPVWFLGYEPQVYMTLFRFSWLFTLDEFKDARAKVGRIEAIVFQEKNAMKQLENAEAAIRQAQQSYRQTQEEQSKVEAISLWQNGIDKLNLVPASTMAGKIAKTKLNSYNRDFAKISSSLAGNNRTNTLITVAKQFSEKATDICDNEPHPVTRWQQCGNLWQEAISRLKQISLEDAGYIEAQSLLVDYQTNLGEIQIRQQAEVDSVRAFESARSQITTLPTKVNKNNRDRVIRQIQQIIIELEKVQAGTTVARQANEYIMFAEQKLQQIER